MDGTGAFAASGIVAADKGAVPPRRSVLIGEALDVVAHLEAAVCAVDKAGEDAADAVRGRRLAHLLFVDADHGIPYLAGNNGLVGSLHPYPFLLRLVDELSGLIGQRAGFALHHVPDVDLAADESFDGGFRPLVVDVARVAAPLALVVERTGRQNALLVERDGDGAEACAGGAHGEDAAHGRGGLLVDDEVVLILRVALVAVGGVGSHELAAFRAGPFDRLDLLGGVPAVKLVK